MISAGTKLGRYEIRAKIGEGGMGEVYLAQDVKLDRKVALKILPTELAANQDRLRRFTQEAKAAAQLNHPNIAHIYEISEDNQTNFIARPFGLAGLYLQLGDKDKTFEWLNQAFDQHAVQFTYLVDPDWDSVRSDPRYAALLQRANLHK